jgi:hypothetical protein
MPNMAVIANNIRFLADHGAWGIMEQGSCSNATERKEMRAWVFAKLMWDPRRDVQELMRDFIWGYYGKAAPAIEQYNDLLQQRYEQFDLAQLGSIRYPMTSEFLKHGFVAQAKAIFDRAEQLADDDQLRGRVETASLPVIYVEVCQLEQELAETRSVTDKAYFTSVIDRLATISAHHGFTHMGDDRPRLDEWLGELRAALAQSQ